MRLSARRLPCGSIQGCRHRDAAHEESAPNGIDRAEDVPTIHRTSHPRDPADTSASRAIRLLPTPAAPQTTTPDTSEAEMAAWIARISSERPINGHGMRIPKA